MKLESSLSVKRCNNVLGEPEKVEVLIKLDTSFSLTDEILCLDSKRLELRSNDERNAALTDYSAFHERGFDIGLRPADLRQFVNHSLIRKKLDNLNLCSF